MASTGSPRSPTSGGKPQVTTIRHLNADILLRIFDQLNYDDKIRLRRVCKRWRQLFDLQLSKLRALRIGQFHSGAYSITSGLELKCPEHHLDQLHRSQTATLFDATLIELPADMETSCYSISRYDYLHRALKQSYQHITMLSLGRLNLSYRLLTVLAHNLPNLEHLELINCATKLFEKRIAGTSSQRPDNKQTGQQLATSIQSSRTNHCNNMILTNPTTPQVRSNQATQQQEENNQSYRLDRQLPSLASFADSELEFSQAVYSNLNTMYNQHKDEQLNMRERLMRSRLVKSCQLVQESRQLKHWPKMRHLLLKNCNSLNEFSLCLILAMVGQTIDHLVVDHSQYLTGEFLNYCGPQLKILQLKNCPMIRIKFLEDLLKLKQLLTPPQLIDENIHDPRGVSQAKPLDDKTTATNYCNQFRNCNNFSRDIYCTL